MVRSFIRCLKAKMRVTWRRNLAGNLVALTVVTAFVITYVKLLQYNKASSTTFNLVANRHRRIRGLHSNHVDHKWKNWTSKSKLPVHVVEEHHQVIPIWMNAVKSGTLKPHGNVLIHIDGHSDMAAPFYFPGYPIFRMPKDSREINMMMQRNDVFIVQSIMTGMLKRIIWVWPKWDQENHEGVYEKVWGGVGMATVRSGEALKEKVICTCTKNQSNIKECSYTPFPHEGLLNLGTEKTIKPSLCNIKREFVLESLREEEAIRRMSRSEWIPKQDPVMLDVDLDYFGCTHVSQPLVDLGMPVASLKIMNGVLWKLFCPKSVKQEQDTDKILVKALNLFLVALDCKSKPQNKQISYKKCKDKARREALDMLKQYLWHQGNRVSCEKKSKESENLLNQLVDLFFGHLNAKQISMLKKIGFCLTTTLNSYLPLTNPGFQICMGSNTPADSMVLTHRPTKNETVKRTSLLLKFLTNLKSWHRPRLVTVCRSIRDGYTPRFLYYQIDQGVMKSINSCFGNTKMHYDSWLLGGKHGWPHRHRT
ncbi:UPF0489 protein C5orf22 homolog [Saccostrea echinata]|uniref:UPF0489 protein C5orf22 homolog n=1 Tax=Saccostrea echinata TaxID=191078 RepID=UPI002A81EFCA|nr:UPF0489 protein C5orf22 homolog [Saccostrea echinata]